MSTYPLSKIVEILGSSQPLCLDRMIDILLTDSRSLTYPEHTLFFAIVTSKGNGHDYIDELYTKGVRAFVISEEGYKDKYPDAAFLMVSNTLRALHLVAKIHRQSLHIPVVGITGSNGKTTLKEILYQLLHSYRKVGRSPKSYNSSIGVPLSLWNISSSDQIALIEAGISLPGEMSVLEEMIAPTLGIITNIGEAHQENFISQQQKCLEKLSLFDHVEHIIYCADDSLIRSSLEAKGMLTKAIGWSRYDESAPVFVDKTESHQTYTLLHLRIQGKNEVYRIPYTDEGAIHDVLLAITLLLNLCPEVLRDKAAFEKLEPISMRLEVIEGNEDCILINDTYNSDFDSFAIALEYMSRRNVEGRPMTLIVSDIRESGIALRDLYDRISKLILRYEISKVYAIGKDLEEYRYLFNVPIDCYRTTDDFLRVLPHLVWKGQYVLIKGARSARFEKIVQALEKRTHQTILDVNLSNLRHNFHHYKSKLPEGTRIICMVKAFGYGVGSFEIAHTLQDLKCDYLAVAVVDEGIALRERGISMPIMVMNPERSAFARLVEHKLQPEIYSLSLLEDFIKVADSLGEKHYPVHVKWDTGMHRMGLSPCDLDRLLALVSQTATVRVVSVFTHLAAADDSSQDTFTLKQISTLASISKSLSESLPYPIYTHVLNTAGITRLGKYAMDMVRLGLGLYGISPIDAASEGLRPVAGLRTVILQVQTVSSGETIGYGRLGKVSRPSRIAIVPIGYADGIDRRLGNGNVSFRTADGAMVPTIGSICMDTLMLDVTDAPLAIEGTEVTVFDEELPIQRLSDTMGTIPYEILSRLSLRIARRYYSE